MLEIYTEDRRNRLGCLALPLEVAHAQEVSAYLGFGGVYDKSNGTKIDTFSDGNLDQKPALNGPFAELGMSVLIGKQWGVGAEITRRLAQGNYAGINYSPSFSSLDAIYIAARISSKRIEPEFRLGIGAARVHYYFDDPDSCGRARLPGFNSFPGALLHHGPHLLFKPFLCPARVRPSLCEQLYRFRKQLGTRVFSRNRIQPEEMKAQAPRIH